MASDLKVKISGACHGCLKLHSVANVDMSNVMTTQIETGVLLVRELQYDSQVVNETGHFYKTLKAVQLDFGSKIVYTSVNDQKIYVLYTLTSLERLGITKLIDTNAIVVTEGTVGTGLTFTYNVCAVVSRVGDIDIMTIDTHAFTIVQSTVQNVVPEAFEGLLGQSSYRIVANVTGTFTAEDSAIVDAVVSKWKSVIYGPVIMSLPQDLECNINFQELDPNVLGQARPTSYINVNGNFIPVKGEVTLNTLNWSKQKQQVKKDGHSNAYYTLLHEFGHVLGIGTMWRHPSTGLPLPHLLDVNVKKTIDNYDIYTKYIGIHALSKYRLNLSDIRLQAIPIEDDGGLGTAGGHPEEGVDTENAIRYYDGHPHPGLDRELMTGISESDNEPEILSSISAGFLHDIGFIVKYSACDDTMFPDWISYNNVLDGVLNPNESIYVNIVADGMDNRFYLENIYGQNYKNIALGINYGTGLERCVLTVGTNTFVIVQGWTVEYSVTTSFQPLVVDIGEASIEGSSSYTVELTDLPNKTSARTLVIHLKAVTLGQP